MKLQRLQGKVLEMNKKYDTITKYRRANRTNCVILLNPNSGDTIEMDKNSMDIYMFIQKNKPTRMQIIEYGKEKSIPTGEIEKFLKCLEESEFIYEVR